ncbi:non-ribosomal peptide synthetase [Xylaria venustula]|nr:non-ribosomal peptide synthetase [Xylaria venustula]
MSATSADRSAAREDGAHVERSPPEAPKSVCDLIDRWAHKQPNHPAILYRSRTVSYRQLNDAAARIACLLIDKHVRPGDLVPVLATRTCEMVATFLGVLKAGACYVPIDVETWGEERTISTLERVSARVVVNLGTSAFPGYDVISREDVESAFKNDPVGRWEASERLPQENIKPGDLAYIIFTSGTTSQPKGVMIPHSALLYYVQQGDEEAPFNSHPAPEDKTLLAFSPGFDAGTGTIFSTICNGAQLMVADMADFESCATEATIIGMTPSMLSAIHNVHRCSQVRTLILGGEPLHARLIEKWSAPGRTIYNAYGPSETTISSLMGKVEPSRPITLGHPMSNSRVILLDGDVESDYGEICITGPGLAVGYYQDETLTAQKFVHWQGERIYRTGDFARRTEHGLEYAGRADSFVKNRGLLVNIDAQVIPLLLQGNAHTATAFMHRDRLVAFVTPETTDTRAFRQSLSQKHDAFLVPDLIRAMPALPMTPNGKADNRALQRLLEAELVGNAVTIEPGRDLRGDSKLETLKLAISTAISLPVSEMAADCNFFDLGGNSLAALKVLSYLRSVHLRLGIKSLCSLPNLKAVSDAIQEDHSHRARTIASVEESEEYSTESQDELTLGPMTALQTKMIQATLKTPGANTMLLRIHIAHPDTVLETAGFKNAWHKVLTRHAIFRTTFDLKDDLQHVNPELELDWKEELTTADQLDDIVQIQSLEMRKMILDVKMQDERFIPVNLFRLITVPQSKSILLLSAHHAQVDGWSFSIILDEVQAVLSGDSSPLQKKAPDFISVSLAQRHLQSNTEGIAFWRELLRADSDLPRLGLPKPPLNQKVHEWTKSWKLDLGITLTDLDKAARVFRVTSSALLYTAWGIVLSNYTSSDRVGFGAVFSGRNLTDILGLDRTVGPLFNTLPFPIEFGTEQTVENILSCINPRLLHMLEFQWSAYEAMTTLTGESINAALQTLLVTEYDLPLSSNSNWILEREDLMEFGLTLLIENSDADGNAYSRGEASQDLQAKVLFNSSLYAESSIHRLITHFRNALTGLMDPDNTYVQDVREQLMDGQEKKTLLEVPKAFSQEATVESNCRYTTVKDSFEGAVTTWPDVCALESLQGTKLTYRELDAAANVIAVHLRERIQGNLPKETVVGILSDGSPHWVIAILAALKAGCICCPIDVDLPFQRIETIIHESGASLLLSATRACADKVQMQKVATSNIIICNEILKASAHYPSSQLPTISESNDVIYLMFTSGSTGIPKGVPLHNQSLLNFLHTPQARLFTEPGRRISQLCSLGFDMVLVELFACLCFGGTFVLKDPNEPFKHLKHVDAIVSTPSLLSALSPDDYENWDTVLLAGEPVSQALADTWSARVPNLFNFYGPSECGCVSTGTQLLPSQDISIGRPLSGMAIYILDHNRCLVPQGITGEIYISGIQLTDGYWNNTNERMRSAFSSNPFSTTPSDKTMYRTGDLGFWNNEMNISYVGRIDSMIKIRGFRVELEEVEHALAAAGRNSIKSSAAIAVGGDNDGTHTNGVQIVGFVTPNNVDLSALRVKLTKMLPGYARPSRLVAISELPMTASRKLDREKLKQVLLATPEQQVPESPMIYEAETGGTELNETERQIAETWKTLLGLPSTTQIHKSDDFIALGGNSVLAIKAARSITGSIKFNIPVALLLRETILESLAKAIDQEIPSSTLEIPAYLGSFSSYLSSTKSGHNLQDRHPCPPLPLSYIESGIFEAYVTSEVKSSYNTVATFLATGAVDVDRLAAAFTALVQDNPVLRSRYFASQARTFRIISSKASPTTIFVHDDLPRRNLQALVDEPFDLEKDQLMKVVILEKSGVEKGIEILLIAHHIIADKASQSLMLQWVSRKYAQLMAQEIALPAAGKSERQVDKAKCDTEKTSDYLEWAQWLSERKLPISLQNQERVRFWQHNLHAIRVSPQLQPHGRIKVAGAPGSTTSIYIGPPSIGTDTAVGAGGRYTQRVAVAGAALALKNVFGSDDLVIGLPYMNREDPATADVLGCFLDRLPLRIQLDTIDLETAKALFDTISTNIALCLDNYLPYEEIKEAREAGSDQKDQDLIDAMLIYDWQSDSLEHSLFLGPDVKVTRTSNDLRPAGSLFPLTFGFVEEGDGGLTVNITFNTEIVAAGQVNTLKAVLPDILQGLARGVAPMTLLGKTI